MFRRILIIGILLVLTTACKSGKPSVVKNAPASGVTAKQAGSGKLDLTLNFNNDLGGVTINDNGVTPFTIIQKQSEGVPIYNEFVIEGQGKIVSDLTTKIGPCTEKSRTEGITTINGKMTGGLNPDASDACILVIKIEVFYSSRTTSFSSCPLGSSATTGRENYAFDLRLPLSLNFNKQFEVPIDVWQIHVAKLIDLKIDQALTGCNLVTNP